MINLFENADQRVDDFIWSLKQAEVAFKTVVINDNGWLDKDMVSPFSFYSMSYDNVHKKPLYFDEVPVPNFWGIRGNDQLAEIYDNDTIRAKIFYHNHRVVERVEWCDKLGKVQFVDHYNCYGNIFARTFFHQNKSVQKTYYSTTGQEIISHNLITDQIILNLPEQTHFFPSETEFVLFFIKQYFQKNEYNQIVYNSLSVPLFIVNRLGKDSKAILIWDEPLDREIPGNMISILNNLESNTKHIFFQRQKDMRKIHNNHSYPRNNIVSYLGKLNHFVLKKSEKSIKNTALIVTNSDDIWNMSSLANQLPHIKFEIMARTEMSARLLQLDMYNNVKLYPVSTEEDIVEAINKTDYLLDINNGPEVLDTVRKAFLSHKLILSIDDFAHNKNYIASENIFANDQFDLFKDKLQKTSENKFQYDEELTKQETIFGPEGQIDLYQKVFSEFS